MKSLFNIYYINFAKVYEIKMMLGNEITTSKNVEHGENSKVEAQAGGNLRFNLLAKSGGVEGKIQGESSGSQKVIETLGSGDSLIRSGIMKPSPNPLAPLELALTA